MARALYVNGLVGQDDTWPQEPLWILYVQGPGEAVIAQVKANMKDEDPELLCYEPRAPRRIEMKPGDVFHITPGTLHRMTGIEDCDILEVSTPELEDVVRLEDRYGRAGTSKP